MKFFSESRKSFIRAGKLDKHLCGHECVIEGAMVIELEIVMIGDGI